MNKIVKFINENITNSYISKIDTKQSSKYKNPLKSGSN